jgi:TetR/AcrR family transcriptional regulator of autoinduction and epiphytic fitness
MTVDEVAADVGIAKASLYKHFASKEALAAAAMVRVLERGAQLLTELAARPELPPLERLRALARWALQQQLAGRDADAAFAELARCAPNCWAARPMSTC